jgi:5-oxoprolinase (ATP-hydrolysing) subunit C
MIEVLVSNALNSVQDRGRTGARRFGVSTSGAMDPVALAIGNAMLGNADDAAAIEVQTFPFSIRFQRDAKFAVTGADCAATLSGKPLPPWWCAQAREGDVLTLSAPRRWARVYLTFAGGIDVPVVMGSRSTHMRAGFGGLDGRALTVGDHLSIGTAPGGARGGMDFGVVPPDTAIKRCQDGKHGPLRIRALRAGEYDLFPSTVQAAFWSTEWKIGFQSDRGGYRLSGADLTLPAPVELRSHGVVAGVVQVPPSGQPIIQMSDANTAGGYPKIAAVIQADLWRLGQAPLGSLIVFEEVDYDEAVAAMHPIDAYIGDVCATADLYQSRWSGE